MSKTHCQICAREIKANTGLIAHHGYKRPHGYGFQTGSCEGSRHRPYEESRDAIPYAIERRERNRVATEQRISEMLTDPPAELTYKIGRREGKVGRPIGFDSSKEGYFGNPRSYECNFWRIVNHNRRYVEQLVADVEYLQRRYDEWK